ncbi:hypothetical protein G6O67_001786 [Ophiocordyceps sinensis]|uniref:Nuclear distribution protein n=1 Tax=Ophiocordyceps sinensis TaxID=72228 RepID=A0A8H4PST1_9HYPO|nr:hypothetical protein G6O67_001786 [Ophiocordyceps sinensis]
MDNPLDQTTLSTISLLESRILRLEHLLYGPTASHPPPAQHESVAWRMGDLEKRFSMILSRVRVYGHLLKIYKSHPDLFHAPASSDPPSQLSTDTIRSMVLAAASTYPAVLSSLTAIKDCPVPDMSESTALVSMTERMKAIQAAQAAQAADMAELRRRSEVIIRSWYERSLLAGSRSMAEIESRVEGVERHVRRRERAMEEDKEI